MTTKGKTVTANYLEDEDHDIFDTQDFKTSLFKVSIYPLDWKQRGIFAAVISQILKQIGVKDFNTEYGVVSSDKESDDVHLTSYVDYHDTKFCKIKKADGNCFQIILPEDLCKSEEGNPIHASTFYSLKHVISELELSGFQAKNDEFIDSFALLMIKLANANKIKYTASIVIDHDKMVYVQGVQEE